jgi:hypothetical protein
MCKKVFRCDTKQCRNETTRTMPDVKWLEMEIVKCEKCGRLILFSTIYPPKPIYKNVVSLP